MDWLQDHTKHLAWNKHQFEKASLQARAEIARKDLLSGIVWAQIAADIAWHRHPGFHASMQLESILVQVAHELDDAISVSAETRLRRFKRAAQKTHVLHVLTEAYATGGHTRAVEAWIGNSRDNTVHSLVATNQQHALPMRLTHAVEASGGTYCSLSDSPNLLHRAMMLRRIGREWPDVIVLHVHPYDALPLVAFGIDGGPPVILFNHADHVFWLGCSVADVVADIRPLGQRLSVRRRGVKNSAILPVPLSDPSPTPDRDISRRQLGAAIHKTVLLTVAGEARYLPFANYDFLGTVTNILRRNSETLLLAVGLQHSGRGAESSAAAKGRIIPMGVRTDLDLFYASADIYLPSFPLGGLTAMLDAGLRGIPILGLHLAEAPHLCGADDLALDGLLTYASTTDEYVASVERLIAEPSLRYEKGRILQDCIRRIHVPPGWNDFLEKVLRSLPGQHKVQTPSPNVATEISDVFQAGLDATTSYTLMHSFLAHASGLPLTNRARTLLGLVVQGMSQLKSTPPRLRFLQAGEIVFRLLPRELKPIVTAAFGPVAKRMRDRRDPHERFS